MPVRVIVETHVPVKVEIGMPNLQVSYGHKRTVQEAHDGDDPEQGARKKSTCVEPMRRTNGGDLE